MEEAGEFEGTANSCSSRLFPSSATGNGAVAAFVLRGESPIEGRSKRKSKSPVNSGSMLKASENGSSS